ncbi:flagellar hook-basal body complex protein FlhP [Lysinibacillus alkalisoli]|uniref:Flagellar hook-basal body complex protein FlhP n=1 Tax=Lysinibacillus alkalisoli TaxID=1911548 RepID=A0A917D5I6_9BACI|nr:flagellar hook-basal body protein [Lysinibacillus alkalisoli]GGG12667.1 flagellar hook-basal body complex protein FlhP [Lysinibacillus alkalisoli]
MLRTMLTATNTMGELQNQLDNIGSNLANMTTEGYKSRDAKFQELLYQQYNNDKLDRAPRQTPAGIRYGVGAHLGQIQFNQKQGALKTTDRDLDFAFTSPKQYFTVLMPDGNGTKEVYTRQGNFYISPLANGGGMLVNGDGYPVADSNGNPITFPNAQLVKEVSLSQQGALAIKYSDGTTLGQPIDIAVTRFNKPQFMEHVSGTYFALPNNMNELGVTEADILTPLRGAGRNEVGLQQGAMEMSNVDVGKETTELIQTQRAYQFNARAVTMADQMLGLINGIR